MPLHKNAIVSELSSMGHQYRSSPLLFLIQLQIFLLFILPEASAQNTRLNLALNSVFGLLSVVTVMVFLVQKGRTLRLTVPVVMVGGFYLLCLYGIVVALLHRLPLSDVVRGLIPFLWVCFAVIVAYAFDRRQLLFLWATVGVISLLYSLRVWIYYFGLVFLHPGQRVTFHLSSATSVVPMIGMLFFLWVHLHTRYCKVAFSFYLFSMIGIFMTETKSMTISAIGALALYVLLHVIRTGLKLGWKQLWPSIIITIIVMIISLGGLGMGARFISGLNVSITFPWMVADNGGGEGDETSEGIEKNKTGISIEVFDEGSYAVRVAEVKASVGAIVSSKGLGQGLGYRWTWDGIDYGGPVIYMHNVFLYFAKDFGAPGLLYLIAAGVVIVVSFFRLLKRRPDPAHYFTVLILFCTIALIFAYANFFAIIRNIPTIFLLALTLGTYVALYGGWGDVNELVN